MQILYCLFLVFIAVFSSCQNDNSKTKLLANNTDSLPENKSFFEFTKPLNGSQLVVNSKVIIELKKIINNCVYDSILLTIEGDKITTLLPNSLSFEWDSKKSKLGKQQVVASVYNKGEKIQSTSLVLFILSDTKPVEYSYKILKVYPHSREAYTQGLIYENGYFYESDGEYRKSALRKVKLETGESTQTVSLEPNIFAEGLALCKNKLFQLSWREQTCFVYDKTTFKLERKFNYSLSEGWGLEFNGEYFLATDGSSFIYFMEPENFTEVSHIQVVDDEGSIESINELELINGQLFANVYTKNIVL